MKRACSTLIARIQQVPRTFTYTHKILFSILLGLSLWGCSSDQPDNLIPQQKMKNILMDMHIIEARSFRISNPDSARGVTKASYQFIFKKYKIDTAQLRSSLEYYLSNSEIMDKMYEEMIDSLSKRQSQLVKDNSPKLTDSAKAKKTVKIDSLKKDSVMKSRFHNKKRDSLMKSRIHNNKKSDSVMNNRFNIKKHPATK